MIDRMDTIRFRRLKHALEGIIINKPDIFKQYPMLDSMKTLCITLYKADCFDQTVCVSLNALYDSLVRVDNRGIMILNTLLNARKDCMMRKFVNNDVMQSFIYKHYDQALQLFNLGTAEKLGDSLASIASILS